MDLVRQRDMQQAREDEERLKQKILALKAEHDKIIHDKIRKETAEECAKLAEILAHFMNAVEKPVALEIARLIREKYAINKGT